jgi:molecular chaperone DnaK
MSAQNRTLGRFDLVGIPPAPRGIPQIEVTFDIDANGIVHVSAKDLGTGKEQKIRIESSSGLSEDEIKRMVRDAEYNAAEDRRERERAETSNAADSLLYSTEKSLRDLGDKVGESDRQAAESAATELRAALASEDAALITSKLEGLQRAAYALAEEIYKDASARSSQADATKADSPRKDPGTREKAGARTRKGGGGERGSPGGAEDVDYEVVE